MHERFGGYWFDIHVSSCTFSCFISFYAFQRFFSIFILICTDILSLVLARETKIMYIIFLLNFTFKCNFKCNHNVFNYHVFIPDVSIVRVLVTCIRHLDVHKFTYDCIFVRLLYIFVYIKPNK